MQCSSSDVNGARATELAFSQDQNDVEFHMGDFVVCGLVQEALFTSG